MAGTGQSNVVFRESQRFGQWWLWLLIAVMVALEWWMFYEQIVMGRPFGNNPGPDWMVWLCTLLFGVGMPWLMFSCQLVTEVRNDALYVRFTPFHLKFRRIGYTEIMAVVPGKYNPIMDYGGWGLRVGKAGRAYNISGNLGVRLELGSSKPLMIGSQQPAELAEAITSAMAQSKLD